MKREVLTIERLWVITRYKNDHEYRRANPYHQSRIRHNIILNEGRDNILSLIGGIGSPQAWSNAAAHLGVGDSDVPESSGHGGLQAPTNKAYKGMMAGYPLLDNNKLKWRSEFLAGEAAFAWKELTVSTSGSNAGINLNRKVQDNGVKGVQAVWTLDFEVSLTQS